VYRTHLGVVVVVVVVVDFRALDDREEVHGFRVRVPPRLVQTRVVFERAAAAGGGFESRRRRRYRRQLPANHRLGAVPRFRIRGGLQLLDPPHFMPRVGQRCREIWAAAS
jgi:hypothetical protein